MATILRQVSDEIDVGDNTVYYSRHRIDTIPVSELVSGRVIRYKIVSDTITLGDSLVRRLSLKRIVQDIITLSESIHIIGQGQTFIRYLSDVIGLTERLIAVKPPAIVIHPEQPFYPRHQKSRFQKRFEYMRL